MSDRLVIIDGNSLVNRAYYAIQRPMITKEGLYTQGVYGFLNMLNKIIKDYDPKYMAVAFDLKAPTFRHLEYSEYKAGRKKMPSELSMQIPILKQVLDAMKIHRIEMEGFEADDIIGTVAKYAEENGLEPLIITGDKDELQLATDVTKVLITRKGISEFDMYDRQAMIDNYGFTPLQFIDFKGLRGDPSDNIPGVPGVGEKTAQKLIVEYGSVENLLENLDSLPKNKMREKIEENQTLAIMSKRLATINTNVPIDIELNEYLVREPDFDKLIDIYSKLEFNSMLKKLRTEGSTSAGKAMGTASASRAAAGAATRTASGEATGTASGAASGASTGAASGTTGGAAGAVTGAASGAATGAAFGTTATPSGTTGGAGDLSDTHAGVQTGLFNDEKSESYMTLSKTGGKVITDTNAGTAGSVDYSDFGIPHVLNDPVFITQDTYFIRVFSDNNHVAKPLISGITLLSAVSGSEPEFYSFDDKDRVRQFTEKWDNIKEIAGHDIKNDLFALMSNGFEAKNVVFDTAIAEYLLDPVRRSYDLPDIVFELLRKTIPTEKEALSSGVQMDLFASSDVSTAYAEYGSTYCKCTAELTPILASKISELSLGSLLREIELPLIEVLASMEKEGISVDRQQLLDIGKQLKDTIDRLTSQIYEAAGEEFNINSPKQLGVILFEKLGLPVGKKTKTGYSTNAEVLEKLADAHPIVSMILNYRMYTKLNGTYVEGMLPLIDENGKIHAHFQQTVTATGRLSCTEPNLQNIPVRTELGRTLRKVFIPEDSQHILVGADYSQIELRVLAHMSDEDLLIEAFKQGDDIHAITAAKVFGIPEDEVTPVQRNNAKVVNFGVIYGMSGFGLSSELSITRKEAENYIKEYFKKYTKVKSFMDNSVEFCKEKGYVTTIMGRIRYVQEINASNHMTRQLGERLAMNSPIQGSAADIIKLAMVKVYKALKEVSSESKLILQIHDELIIQSPIDEADKVQKTLEDSMQNAVKLKVPMIADSKTANSWYELK